MKSLINMTQWLSLQRNNKALEKGGEKLPYFRLSLPPTQEGGEWKEIGAAWKSKNGKDGSYSLKLADGVRLVFDDTYGEQEHAID
jgi:hypothetical protein